MGFFMTTSQQKTQWLDLIIIVHIWIFCCWVGDVSMNDKIKSYTMKNY